MCSEEIIRRQSQVDKQYAGLKELAEDRRKKLDLTFNHFLLSREVEDLEQWISERDVVASSQEMGQDLDHVTVFYIQTIIAHRGRETGRQTGHKMGKMLLMKCGYFFRLSDTDGRFYTHWDRLVQCTSMWSSPIILLKC